MRKLLIGFLALIVFVSGCVQESQISGNVTNLTPYAAEQLEPEVFGDGEILVTFEVKIPDWTPPEDKIFLYIDDFWHPPGGGIPLKEKLPGTWSIAFLAPPNQLLKYRYNRNNYEYTTDEEFLPDSPEARREIEITNKSVFIQDVVRKWRWLSETPPRATISDFRPANLPDREHPFVIGIFMLDFFHDSFTEFIPSTFDRIKEKGFKYVGITGSGGTIVKADPLEIASERINSYSDEQLEYSISEAEKKGLKIILAVGMEVDPGNYSQIGADLNKKHSDVWWGDYIKKWEQTMIKAARTAEQHNIEIFIPSNQWPFFTYESIQQKHLVNSLINNAYQEIRNVYSGIISSDFYFEDENFDFYRQMNWIGDKWWHTLTDKKDPSIEEMKQEAERIIDEKYEPVYEKYKKPIFLQQLAYASYDGGAGGAEIPNTEGPEVSEWYPYNNNYPSDFQEQADAYEAVFQAVYDEPVFAGIGAFSYTYWNSYDKSASIRGKPAEEVWTKWNDVFA